MQSHMAYYNFQLHTGQASFPKSMISGTNITGIHPVFRHVFLLFTNIFLLSASYWTQQTGLRQKTFFEKGPLSLTATYMSNFSDVFTKIAFDQNNVHYKKLIVSVSVSDSDNNYVIRVKEVCLMLVEV